MRVVAPRIVVALGLLCAAASPLAAQDAHYWNLQYGTRAELLGGAVIGSKVGLSNTYYNPGGLGLLEQPSLVLSSLAVELTSLSLSPPPPVEDLGALRMGTVPSFVAGSLWFRVQGSNIAYSFLTRQDFQVRMQLRADAVLPGAGGDPDTSRSGEILREVKANENWVGWSWARSVRGDLGIGFTQYFAYRSQRIRRQATALEAEVGGDARSAYYIDEFDYWNLRTLLKLGVLYEADTWSAGVTTTTPSLGILGNGSVYTSFFDPLAPGLPLSGWSLHKDLEPDYSSRWALGAGFSLRFGDTRVHTSAEWFQAVPRTVVLSAPPFPENSTGTQLSNSAVLELDSVTNFGIGVEQVLTEHTQVFGSYITNFSARPQDLDTNMVISSWDIHQFTGGANFTFRGIEFTVGLEAGFGGEELEDLAIASGTGDSAGIAFTLDHTKVRYMRLEGFLGFTFLFGDSPDEKPKQTLGAEEG